MIALFTQTINLRSKTRRRFDLSLEVERSSKDFKAFWRKWMDSMLWSLSAATIRTFRVLPPSVAISALRVLRCREFRISIRSGMRSERSSQHSEALNISLPSPPPPPLDSTVISSVSEGTVSSSVISEVCCFSSLTRCTTLARSEALSVWTIQVFL